MVRLAEQKDLPQVLELLKEFHAESLNAFSLFCDDNIAMEVMKKLYPTSFVLELEGKIVGMLAGQIAVFPLNNERIYHEWAWYVTKKYRLHGVSLYHKLEDYCKEEGINKIVMITLGENANKVEKFYRRLGFRFLEKHFIKELGGQDGKKRESNTIV